MSDETEMLINVMWMGERNNTHFGISVKYTLDSRIFSLLKQIIPA